MALIDTSQLTLDADFVDPIIIIHRKPVVDQFGQNQLLETQVSSYGSVQPASGKTLQRLPEALRVANVSSFYIQGLIISDGNDKYPDILVFRGERYAVQLVIDYMNYGVGYSEGTCVRERPS